jgi:hypothetical protein
VALMLTVRKVRMNKTKRVAWHKHLKKAKKRRDKAGAAAPQRPTQTRR